MKTAYTLNEMQKERAKAYKQGMKRTLEVCLNALALELYDKAGLDKQTCDKVMQGVHTTFLSMQNGEIEVEDVQKTLKEEYDLTIIME